MRLVRSGALIYMDVEAANRLLYYVDLAYNELWDDKEQSDNCIIGRMLQDVIAHQEDYQDPRLYEPDPSDFRPETICSDAQHRYCLKCTDPLRGQYPFCPLNPPEVIPDGA